MKRFEKLGVKKLAFLQALGLSAYITSIGILLFNADKWFPKNNVFAPIVMLTLLSVSVLICGFLTFGLPIYLFWEKKEARKAIKLVAITLKWLVVFLFTVLLLAYPYR